MGVVVLIVLAAVWAAFLLPPILRARSEHRPSGSITDFRRQLHVLSRATPAGTGAPQFTGRAMVPSPGRGVPIRNIGPAAPGAPLRLGRKQATIKRRRDVFVGLLVTMAGSLVLGALPPLRVLWTIHLLVDVLFVAYVAALIYLRNQAAEREMKVRFLPHSAPEPALLLRRSAN